MVLLLLSYHDMSAGWGRRGMGESFPGCYWEIMYALDVRPRNGFKKGISEKVFIFKGLETRTLGGSAKAQTKSLGG
jgi:hypothetical protein